MRIFCNNLHTPMTLWVVLVMAGCHPPAQTMDEPYPANRPGVGTLKGTSLGKADGACGELPHYYMQYLDDTQCQKKTPSDQRRDHVCPTQFISAEVVAPQTGDIVNYQPAGATVEVDQTALNGVVPSDLNVTLILIRRIGGVPHYRYLSNGTSEVTFQPWSSTKFMAVANAGSTLRRLSEGRVGLTGSVDGLPLGDLISVVHNYVEDDYTSNALARWFLNVGGRDQLDHLLHDGWLGRPVHEKVGGNYGAATAAIGHQIEDIEGSIEVSAPDGAGPENHLSTHTIAEFLKRLVMHREDPTLAYPHLLWSDVQSLLYGARASSLFESHVPQGMQGDTTIYIQDAFNIEEVEARSNGRWRIFGKLGFGGSRGGEFVNAGYGCIPVLDDDGKPVEDEGSEFVLVTQFNANHRYHQRDSELASIYGELLRAVHAGQIK